MFKLNPEYAKEIGVITRKEISKPKSSVESAEFIGIMLGDGGISDYQINITFNRETDMEYSKHIQKLINKLFSISASVTLYRPEKFGRIVVSGRNLVEFLKDKGLKVGNKVKNQVDIPRWIMKNKKYSIACLRGLLDTDGSFYEYRHKVFNKEYRNFAMCFTNHSQPLLISVYKILKELCFEPVRNSERVYLYKRKDIWRYFQEVNSHNPKHIMRYKSYVYPKK